MGATEKAVQEIRRLILAGEVVNGDPLRQVALSKRLGLSLTPVREALKMLEEQHLVRYETNIGYTVAPMSLRELNEIYAMRALLEPVVLRSLRRPSADELEQMDQILDHAELLAKTRAWAAFLDRGREFHLLLYSLSDMPLFVAQLTRLWSIAAQYRNLAWSRGRDYAAVTRMNRSMLSAVRAGNLEKLVAVAEHSRAETLARWVAALSGPGPAAAASDADSPRRRTRRR